MQMRSTTLLVLLSFAFAASVNAQATQAQCDSAVAHVGGQPLPPVRSDRWAYWWRVRSCGAQGLQAITDELGLPALQSDNNYERVEQFFAVLWGIRAGGLYDALTNLALNATASKAVRLNAIRGLGKVTQPAADFDTSQFNRPFLTMCGARFNGPAASGDSTTLPPGFDKASIATLATIEKDQSAPEHVRGSAHCWGVELRRYQPFDPAQVKVTYLCGHRFNIRNDNADEAIITYTVGKNLQSGQTILGPLSDHILTVGVDGVLRISYNGQEIASKANGGTACP
jgi:hypothetical protein